MKKFIKWFSRFFERKYKVEHEIVFAGKKHKICSKGRPKIPPQQFIDQNAVACGQCGEMMLPGSKIWLYPPEKPEELDKPAILAVGYGEKRVLVACLRWDCCPTAALMCGELNEKRSIVPFESIMQKALRTKEPVIVSDISTYRS